jgi:hypothetical protein
MRVYSHACTQHASDGRAHKNVVPCYVPNCVKFNFSWLVVLHLVVSISICQVINLSIKFSHKIFLSLMFKHTAAKRKLKRAFSRIVFLQLVRENKHEMCSCMW